MEKRKHISVRAEIMTIFALFVAAIMGVFLTIYSQSMSEIRQSDLNHLTENSRQLANTANAIITDMGTLFKIQYEDIKLRNILSNSRNNYDEKTRFQNTTYVENTISHAISGSEYMLRCSLFTAGGDVYSNTSSVFHDYREFIFGLIESGKAGGSIYYSEPRVWSIGLVERRVVTGIKVLYNYNGTMPLAYLVMDINYDKLEELLKAKDDGTGTMLLSNENPIYSNPVTDLPAGRLDELKLKSLKMADEGREQEIINVNGKNYLTTAIKSVNTGWVLVRYIDEQDALRTTSMRQRRDIAVLILTAVFVFIVYYYRISKMMEPLSLMDKAVQNNSGELLKKVYLPSKKVGKAGENEITSVVRNYNDMAERINEYTDKILKYELSQKEAQIKMLTYQINPHFLYNTLNTVSAMAELENLDHIVKMTESISNIFRYNLKGETTVSLREELSHVKDYVQIQKYRFPDRFQVFYVIPEELYEIKIMKFILQPLVENSISHGFTDQVRGGEITVEARTEGKMLLLSVKDNGSGINKKRLEEINRILFAYRMKQSKEEMQGGDGIGIMNVNARITEYYGRDCGVVMLSSYGEGTEAVIRLKAEP